MAMEYVLSPEDMRGLEIPALARLADCHVGAPDTPGADYLDTVRQAVADACDEAIRGANGDPGDIFMRPLYDRVPEYTEISIWTDDRWQAFVDLRAWNEEPPSVGRYSIEDDAMWRLCEIGDRLARALLDAFSRWTCEQVTDPEPVTSDWDALIGPDPER